MAYDPFELEEYPQAWTPDSEKVKLWDPVTDSAATPQPGESVLTGEILVAGQMIFTDPATGFAHPGRAGAAQPTYAADIRGIALNSQVGINQALQFGRGSYYRIFANPQITDRLGWPICLNGNGRSQGYEELGEGNQVTHCGAWWGAQVIWFNPLPSGLQMGAGTAGEWTPTASATRLLSGLPSPLSGYAAEEITAGGPVAERRSDGRWINLIASTPGNEVDRIGIALNTALRQDQPIQIVEDGEITLGSGVFPSEGWLLTCGAIPNRIRAGELIAFGEWSYLLGWSTGTDTMMVRTDNTRCRAGTGGVLPT